MKEVLDDVVRWQAEGRRVAIARVVGVVGFEPARGRRGDGRERRQRGGRLGLGRLCRGRGGGGRARDPRRRARAGRDHVRLLRRGRVLRRADLWRDDPPLRRAGRGPCGRRASCSARSGAAVAASEPVALVTVVDGVGIGSKLLVRPGAEPIGTLGDPDLDRVVGRDALGELEAGLTLHPSLRRARRSARRGSLGVHRVVRGPAPDDHLRRGRLHRRARQGGEAARFPGRRCATPARCSRPCNGSRWPTRS